MYKLKYINMVNKISLYEHEGFEQPKTLQVDQLNCN